MVGIAELAVSRVQKSPGAMTGSMHKQGPDLLTVCQVYAVVYFTADIVYMSGTYNAFLQGIILALITQTNFVILPC